jgi:hypothetical protein
VRAVGRHARGHRGDERRGGAGVVRFPRAAPSGAWLYCACRARGCSTSIA